MKPFSNLNFSLDLYFNSNTYLFKQNSKLIRHRGMIANEHIRIGSHSHEKVKTFKYFGSIVTNQNSIQDEIKCKA